MPGPPSIVPKYISAKKHRIPFSQNKHDSGTKQEWIEANSKNIFWWVCKNLARARMEPEIVPDPPCVMPKYKNVKVFMLKNKNDDGHYAGMDRALFPALIRTLGRLSESIGEANTSVSW